MALGAALAIAALCGEAQAQMGPNPYRPVDGLQAGEGPGRIGQPWTKLPGGREMGSPGGVEIDVDGEHLWAIVRCGSDGTPRGSQTYCDDSDLDPIIKFDPDGNVVTMFGSRMFSWPHGIHVDQDGNVWVTEAGESEEPMRGHQVFKFSPEGEVLMTLGGGGSFRGWIESLERPERRDHGSKWRHLRRGRSQHGRKQPDRALFPRRNVHQDLRRNGARSGPSCTDPTRLQWTRTGDSSSPTVRTSGS